ncbi:MAG: aconitase family protein, partial [Oscillospiraceae bacterium]
MTTETTCLTSIWETDNKVAEYYDMHGRKADFKQLNTGDIAYYDGCIYVDLSTIKPMIAMPFHPSNVYEIAELNNNLDDILNTVEMTANMQIAGKSSPLSLRDKVKDGFLQVEQGIIAGCAGGTFDNICDAADILNGKFIGSDEFALAVYPSSQPTYLNLVETGAIAKLMATGATIKTAFCGPCFGAGDVPSNNGLSIRHSTRNFPNREGSKPGDKQIASVALMDARSIAATAANKGRLIPATDIDVNFTKPKYFFNQDIYKNRCYNGYNKPDENAQLKFGPNITDWPKMSNLSTNMLLKVSAFINDPV